MVELIALGPIEPRGQLGGGEAENRTGRVLGITDLDGGTDASQLHTVARVPGRARLDPGCRAVVAAHFKCPSIGTDSAVMVSNIWRKSPTIFSSSPYRPPMYVSR